ncbi:hypothetical protein ABGB14_22400 [Nonomuraea sp. B10E15]|uniref:hypothetical protein n=1 Tax=Nonomuraea sp. B10E15 TaxID=3153560 RepID=UPI00325E15FB
MSRPPSHFDYHGLHVAAPNANAVRVDWVVPQSRAVLLRVREHTCGCTYPMFELCAGAGLSFVRLIPSEDPDEVRESPWVRARLARELWVQILTGQAR